MKDTPQWLSGVEPIEIDLLTFSQEMQRHAEYEQHFYLRIANDSPSAKMAAMVAVLRQAIVDVTIQLIGTKAAFSQICETRVKVASIMHIHTKGVQVKNGDEFNRLISRTYEYLYRTIAENVASQLMKHTQGTMIADLDEMVRKDRDDEIAGDEKLLQKEKVDADFLIDLWRVNIERKKQLKKPISNEERAMFVESMIENLLCERQALQVVDDSDTKPEPLALGKAPDALYTLVQPELVIHHVEMGLKLLV